MHGLEARGIVEAADRDRLCAVDVADPAVRATDVLEARRRRHLEQLVVRIRREHVAIRRRRAHRHQAARDALEALRDPGLRMLDQQRATSPRRCPHGLVVLEVPQIADRSPEAAPRHGGDRTPELHVALAARRVDHEVGSEGEDRLAQLGDLGRAILDGGEVDLEGARGAAFMISGLARRPLREVAESTPLEGLEEGDLDEPVHQLDRRGIGHRDEQADICLDEQLERRRREPRAEIDHDPVRGQLTELLAHPLDLGRRGLRHPRRIGDPGDQLDARDVRGDRELGERRAPDRERLGQRARRPGHAGEQVQVRRAERAVDEDHALAERREEDPDVGGDEALAYAALSAADGDHPRCHVGGIPAHRRRVNR